ncbi:MAG: IclR family transcriptional regulator [Paracoccus denitrificans]|nr:MAG: IclR family transcriptional regulator [Paracoccus denitrificans]PZO85485.1 MAG: IclR family transcriptional regulator [Paracoccus denitrificans]
MRDPDSTPRPTGRPRQSDRAAGSKVVDRALDALVALAAQDGVTLTALAAALQLAPSTTHRLLASLASRRLAEVDDATGQWTVGPGAYRLGAAFLRKSPLAERAAPMLRQLAQTSGETAILAVADGDGALIVAQAEPASAARAALPQGTRLPMHTSAVGKALICHLPLARVEALLGSDLPALTPASLTDQGALTADLATIRQVGAAFEAGETDPHVNSIAAPVFGGGGDPVAAVGLAGPAARLTQARMNQLGAELRQVADDLGRALGRD